MKSVEEIMSGGVTTLESDTYASMAAETMMEQDIGSVVVTKERLPVGIITERDFVRIAARGFNPDKVQLAEVMSAPLIAVDNKTLVADAAQLMSNKNIRRLPVIKGNELVGIVTERDITRHVVYSYGYLV